MSDKELDTLIQIREYFRFELHRKIKEFGGAANFKTEDAINVLDKILKEYKVNLIEFKESNEIKEEIERLHSIIKEVREYIEDACWLDEINKNNILGHKQTMKVLEILDKENKE